ncbi:MAG: hypothetical protein JSR17_10940 [Proteobacteria bacterium]|nr:hypothetical protein [Pseudomonadota bacterium]
MNTSTFWARVLGLYMFIVGVGMFFTFPQFQQLVLNLSKDHALLMITGIFTLFLGLTIVVSHQVYRGWPILITLLGYWVSIKGCLLIFFPSVVNQFITLWQTHNMSYASIPSVVLGLILLILTIKK